jgi:hypothetical protein
MFSDVHNSFYASASLGLSWKKVYLERSEELWVQFRFLKANGESKGL